MGKILIVLYFLIFSNLLFAQKDIKPIYKIDEKACQAIFNFLDIKYTKFELDKKFNGAYSYFIVDEYENGKIIKTINFKKEISPLENFLQIKDDFGITFISKNLDDSTIKLNISNGIIQNVLNLNLKRDQQYAWKNLFIDQADSLKLQFDSLNPLIVFTSAVSKEHARKPEVIEFCKMNNELTNLKEWYSKLGVVHYFVFNLVLEKELK